MKNLTMNYLLLFLIYFNIFASGSVEAKKTTKPVDFILSTKKIEIEGFPEAWNPSLLKTETGFLLTFRHCLHPVLPWVSYIGIVKLDNDLNVVSAPQLLNTRREGDPTPAQSEDARIFSFNDKIYVIYNDNEEQINPTPRLRRDMFIAELQEVDDRFVLSTPLKIVHEQRYPHVRWQKNWVPFEWNNQLFVGYSINPHEVLSVNLRTGLSKPLFNDAIKNAWSYGHWRGGTPAILVDGNYLAFFHSAIVTKSEASPDKAMHHYYMGAYLFSGEPPFNILQISGSPIIADGFYTQSSYDKRVIFPGGIALVDNQIYLAYGKDDSEVWITILDKDRLMESLKPAKKK